ncbi:hypothetical protein NKR19_g9259 [Coniochaeta hoffmannii]|uniref:Uncharacterized protein n=1 Tax=Coniochaeta hoffmannii TaxID=91930 RepID=A0AA38VBK8_9PEZI|nr:hypothetical protein NKR19_g9259 [Coniochaeta hoffmannii]
MSPPTRLSQLGVEPVVVAASMGPGLVLEHDACFHCIWRNLEYFSQDIKKLAARPRVTCFNVPGDSRCEACIKANTQCEKISAAREGDVRDLFKLLEWCDRVHAHENAVRIYDEPFYFPFWTDKYKRAVLHAALDLMAGFRNAEELHRSIHRLDLEPGATEASRATIQYAAYLTIKKTNLELLHPCPAPTDPDALRRWENARLPRLRPTDRGFLDFECAKRHFKRLVLHLLKKTDHGAMSMFSDVLPDDAPV